MWVCVSVSFFTGGGEFPSTFYWSHVAFMFLVRVHIRFYYFSRVFWELISLLDYFTAFNNSDWHFSWNNLSLELCWNNFLKDHIDERKTCFKKSVQKVCVVLNLSFLIWEILCTSTVCAFRLFKMFCMSKALVEKNTDVVCWL